MKKLSILLVVVCSGLTVAQAPPNDTCQTSTLVGAGIHPGTTLGATSSLFGTGTCGLQGIDVWYRYVATGSGNKLIASTCAPGSSTFGSGVDIFTGGCLSPPTTAGCSITWCDNAGITGGRAVATTTAGVTYLIRVKTVSGSGTFNLYVDELPGAAQPNGTCANATPVIDGVNAGYTNFGEPAALAAGFSPMCSTAGKDVFFLYQATATGGTTVRTCFLNPTPVAAIQLNDSVIAVYANCTGAPALACFDDGCSGSGGTGSSLSFVTFPSIAGTFYVIQVAGAGSGTAAQEGMFDLEILPPPPNDECATPIALVTGPNGPFSNVTATDSIGLPSCGTAQKDLWYSYTPTCGSPTVITTGCNGMDSLLVVYNSCGGTEIACNDNEPTFVCGLSSSVTVNLTAGTTYIIRVGTSFFSAPGSFNVDITPGLGLNWSSPLGPGTARFAICNGPPNGTYFLFATLLPGAFPNGWFYGLDITLQEISAQIAFGSPFNGPLDASGSFTSPIFGNVPSGLTVFSIAFGVPTGQTFPSGNSGAKSYTVP